MAEKFLSKRSNEFDKLIISLNSISQVWLNRLDHIDLFFPSPYIPNYLAIFSSKYMP